jgi:hypothetical protein
VAILEQRDQGRDLPEERLSGQRFVDSGLELRDRAVEPGLRDTRVRVDVDVFDRLHQEVDVLDDLLA